MVPPAHPGLWIALERLGGAPLDTLHVLDTSEADAARPFVKKMEGEDLPTTCAGIR
jgi:hypothetical protein